MILYDFSICFEYFFWLAPIPLSTVGGREVRYPWRLAFGRDFNIYRCTGQDQMLSEKLEVAIQLWSRNQEDTVRCNVVKISKNVQF